MKTASEPEQIGVVVVIEVTSGTILTSTVAELVNGTLQLVNDTLLKAITTFEVGVVIVTVACPEVGMVTVWFEPLLIVYVTTDPAVPLIVNTASEPAHIEVFEVKLDTDGKGLIVMVPCLIIFVVHPTEVTS